MSLKKRDPPHYSDLMARDPMPVVVEEEGAGTAVVIAGEEAEVAVVDVEMAAVVEDVRCAEIFLIVKFRDREVKIPSCIHVFFSNDNSRIGWSFAKCTRTKHAHSKHYSIDTRMLLVSTLDCIVLVFQGELD